MSGLKTLKDFEREQYSEGAEKDGSIVRYIDERELKAEAVKDIEAIHKDELVCDDVETYIKWKFNLTSEDLK